MFQRCKHYLAHTGFLVPGDASVCDNAAIHAKGDNSHLTETMKGVGADAVT